jgi:hypothetical protein
MVFAATSGFGQPCPKDSYGAPSVPSESRTLEGKLLFHNGIRQWFELRLDKSQCGEDSIQLVGGDTNEASVEVLRGCRVRSRGALDIAHTGYFSASVYQSVDAIEPVGACRRKPPFPDYSRTKLDGAIREYRVDMRVDYKRSDRPIVFRVTSAGRELRPWQAYASYLLTGGGILYGHCGEGFSVDRVFGTPEARSRHFDDQGPVDMAMFDPEDAAVEGKTDLRLGYTCVRGK